MGTPTLGNSDTPTDRSCTIVDQGTLTELLARGHDLSKLVRPSPVQPDPVQVTPLFLHDILTLKIINL